MRKKDLQITVELLNKRVANLEQRSYKIIEVLKASGILEVLEQGEDMVTIPYHTVLGDVQNHYKINEVF
jgi:hypothetical protein